MTQLIPFNTDLYSSDIARAGGAYSDQYKKFRSLPSLSAPQPDQNQHMYQSSHASAAANAAHMILDIFTSIPPQRMRSVAVPVFGRVFYALRFLLNAAYSASISNTSRDMEDALKLNGYLEALA